MSTPIRKADAVFEGGGVKGTGLVGAVAYAESLGYTWENVAGTSAGAIVASLIAAGYSGLELKTVLEELDYNRFKDRGVLARIPLVGPAASLVFQKGMYQGDFLTEWLEALFREKTGIRDLKFGDLHTGEKDPKYRYKLRVIASDLSRGNLLCLPQDISAYGMEPDQLSVVAAVRMSMSIPFFFRPVPLTGGDYTSWVVDGGVLSNFPVWLFDCGPGETPEWPTFGFKLVEPNANVPRTIRGPITLLGALFSTMMEAHDTRYIKDAHFARTIPIPTLGVGTIEFDISLERRQALYESGYAAARRFFEKWDFDAYVKEHRSGEAPDVSA